MVISLSTSKAFGNRGIRFAQTASRFPHGFRRKRNIFLIFNLKKNLTNKNKKYVTKFTISISATVPFFLFCLKVYS